jgi:hypothetical protein
MGANRRIASVFPVPCDVLHRIGVTVRIAQLPALRDAAA